MPKPSPLRRKFLVDPELQIGLSIEMVGWIYVYFLLFSAVANTPNLMALATSKPETAAYLAAVDELRGFARNVVLPMGITFVAMSIHGVYVTHRVAGPVVRMKRAMREIAARRIPGPFSLRKKDHFKDLADEMNAAVAVLREDSTRRQRMSRETTEKLTELVRLLENRPDDLRPAIALAHSVLDGAESLTRHLDATTDATRSAVPLPEADLPAVVDEEIDELDPQAARPA